MKTNYFFCTLLSIVCISAPAFSQSQGPNNPSAAISLPALNGKSWTAPQNVFTSDNTFSTAAALSVFPTCASQNCCYTTAMVVTGFGFNIPLNATINGIIVEIERACSNPGIVIDSAIRILKNAVPVGPNKSNLLAWPLNKAYSIYGSASDVWLTSWLSADINNVNFGVYISARNTSNTQLPTAMIDHVRITVFFTISSVQYSASSASGNLFTAYTPGTGAIEVSYQLGGMNKGKLMLTNLLGKTVFAKELGAPEGKEDVQTAGMLPGIYFMQLSTSERSQTRKILIQ